MGKGADLYNHVAQANALDVMLHRWAMDGGIVTSVTDTFDAYVGKVMFVSLDQSTTATDPSCHPPAS